MSKYKVIHAFAYTNESIMRKLEKYSAEGWHFKKFLGFFVLLEKGEKVATLSLRMPDSTRYYYIHYEEITNNFAHYDWYDEEYYTVSEIAKQLNIILDRF